MMRRKIKDILDDPQLDSMYLIRGWVKTKRASKGLTFIELNDGSTLKNLQLVFHDSLEDYAFLDAVATGAALEAEGTLIKSLGKGQAYELNVHRFVLMGPADPETYPLQKKRHSFEFLRQIGHLRPRTNTFSSVFRVRSALAYAIHRFFNDRGFVYIHTPIVTGSDCEGAGEMFRVTTLDLANPPHTEGGIDYTKDFFKKPTYLTVSGQLEGELFALGLGEIYTFGPTFRSENSNTTRHLAEFWMIEPEMAFYDLNDNMTLAEDFLKAITSEVLEHCPVDMEFFDTWIEKGLLQRLHTVISSNFARITYSDAIKVLESSGQEFEFPPYWGCDLQTEHERFLSEQYFKLPVIVYNYPRELKAFYMRVNEDRQTVAAMDVLVPKIGEIIGGSQREERYDMLQEQIELKGLNMTNYGWYLDTRRYGSVYHSGFGLGFERMMMFITGMTNIRDVIPIPRYPGYAEF